MVAVGLVPARLPPVSRRLAPPPLLPTILTLARIFFFVSRSNIHLARHPGEARSCKRYRPVATSLAGRSSLDCWIETNSGQEILAMTSPTPINRRGLIFLAGAVLTFSLVAPTIAEATISRS